MYDAIIAATSRQFAATLVTRDRRAAATYAALGVKHETITGS